MSRYVNVDTIKHLIDIKTIPIDEVVEVVPGEWIKTTIAEGCGTDEVHRTVYRDRETVKCSECGNPSPIYNIKFEFCPHCGAKMNINDVIPFNAVWEIDERELGGYDS